MTSARRFSPSTRAFLGRTHTICAHNALPPDTRDWVAVLLALCVPSQLVAASAVAVTPSALHDRARLHAA